MIVYPETPGCVLAGDDPEIVGTCETYEEPSFAGESIWTNFGDLRIRNSAVVAVRRVVESQSAGFYTGENHPTR